MKITTVLFDLDGTLLPMDQDVFVGDYFGRIAAKVAPAGYDPKQLIDTIWSGTAAMVKNDGSKPNSAYYRDVPARLNVKPEECLMVGNDVGEDMIAEQLGMKVFLLTDCMINIANEDISVYPHGSFDDLKNFLNTI